MEDETPDIRLRLGVTGGGAAAMEPRDKTLDIRISQLIRPRLQTGDETPDIRLRPTFSGSTGHGAER